MTNDKIDIIALAKKADCEIVIITGSDDSDIDDYRFTEHELANFSDLLEAEIVKREADKRKEYEEQLEAEKVYSSMRFDQINDLKSQVNALTEQNAKLMEALKHCHEVFVKYEINMMVMKLVTRQFP